MAVGLAIEMLAHPTRYAWMEFETDDVGALDDVVLLRNDGRLVLRQVKFSTDADREDDRWTWEALLSKQTEKSKSLLCKWIHGVKKALERSAREGSGDLDAAIVTNRLLHDEVQSVLNADFLAMGRLEDSLIDRICKQVSREDLKQFCESMHWDTDWPDYNVLEGMQHRRFLQLGGSNEGWLSLRSSIRDWVRDREQPQPNARITVQHLRRAALWCPLESLPQDFEVPADFVLPCEVFHESLVGRLLDRSTNLIVVTGSPGIGKSTYLSYLTGTLQGEGMPVIRHHYWLSTKDDRRNRLEFGAVATSLMANLEEHYYEAVQQVAGKNPQAQILSEWLESAATYFEGEGKRLVVIIDGLDHIWRESDHSAHELGRLLDQIPFSQPGLVVLLGTQDLSSRELTPKLFRLAPRKEWLELPFMDTAAIRRLLIHHAQEFDLPGEVSARDYVLGELALAFSDRSNGHPLHLRYCLEVIKENGAPLTKQVVYALPECPHKDILEYYRNLLDTLEEEATLALQLIVEARFPLAEDEIGDCLVTAGSAPAAAQKGFQSIRHMLRGTGVGWVAFHGSIRQFFIEVSRFRMHQSRLRSALLDWLRQQGDDERRWAHEWLLEADWNANEVPLRHGPDRDWAVRAIVRGRPLDQAEAILRESALASLRSQDLEGFVQTGLLAHYVSNVADLYHYERHRLMMPLLRLQCNHRLFDTLLTRIYNLNAEELLELIRFDCQFHQRANAEYIFKRMCVLWEELRDPSVLRETAGWGEVVRSLLRACAYVDRGVEFALECARGLAQKPPFVILAEACREYVRTGNLIALRRLYQGCSAQTNRVVARYYIQTAIHQGVDIQDDFDPGGDMRIPLLHIHANIFTRQLPEAAPYLPTTELFQKPRFDLMEQREAVVEWFVGLFWSCVAYGIEERFSAIDDFIGRCGAPPWTTQFLESLASAAKGAGRDIVSRQVTQLDSLYERFSRVPEVSWHSGDPDNEFRDVAREALARISLELRLVQRAYEKTCSFSRRELVRAMDTPHFRPSAWIDEYLGAGQLLLDGEAASWLAKHLGALEDLQLAECDSRAATYARLAGLAAFHGHLAEAYRFVDLAAQNLLSHGWRKDILFFSVLECIESCRAAEAGRIREWLMQITPAVLWVHAFTDGSETNALPVHLAEAFGKAAPGLLHSYYVWLSEAERYDNAQEVLHCILEYTDLNDAHNRALCRTAIDSGSLHVIRRLVEDGKAGAAELQEELGPFVRDDVATGRAQEDAHDFSRPWAPPVPLPAVSEYPPEKFTEYVKEVKALVGFDRGDCIRQWAVHWGVGPGRTQVREVLLDSQALLGELIPRREMYVLVKDHEGRLAAHPWLVKGYAEDRGWSYLRKDDAMWYWQRLKEDFPERWHEFLAETYVGSLQAPERRLHAYITIPRIIDFLLFLGHKELAVKATEAVVSASLGYVSALPLETPTWCIAAATE